MMTSNPAECITTTPGTAQALLADMFERGVILKDEWDALSPGVRQRLSRCNSLDVLLSLLMAHGVLSEFQANLLRAGNRDALVVGPYRLLRRLGSGKRGELFDGEHRHLRRPVLVRMLEIFGRDRATRVLELIGNLKILLRLNHRNVLVPIDAHELTSADSTRVFVISERVAALDFEKYMAERGPLLPEVARHLVCQIASAIAAGHDQGLTHRELAPSSILVTPERQAKVVDFGFALRQSDGTWDREIAQDMASLGGLLYWCLTGQNAGCSSGMHPLVPPELEVIIARSRSERAERRFPSVGAMMQALRPELPTQTPSLQSWGEHAHVSPAGDHTPTLPEVLIIDDDPEIRSLCRSVLEPEGIRCDEADCGAEALRITAHVRYDLVLLDMAMPGMNGEAVCAKLRANPPCANLKILLFAGHMSADELAGLLAMGADDYVTKPFSVVQLLARIKAALRLKEAQDRAHEFHQHLLGTNLVLEQNLSVRDHEVVEAHKALVLAMAKLVECRDIETGSHVRRLQSYCRCLAAEAAELPAFADRIDADFIRWLEWCAPLHDIGKAGIPDAILQKPGPLNAAERRVIQRHTVLGAETLAEVARQHGAGMAFLQMAIDIARHHHERFDGKGYPDALADHSIPLSARVVAIADVYDALRSRRVYKPPIPHDVAVQTILDESPGQFDPALLQAFARCADHFDQIFTSSAN